MCRRESDRIVCAVFKAFNPDLSAVRFDNFLHGQQTQSRAFDIRVGFEAPKRREQARGLLPRQSLVCLPFVHYGEPEHIVVRPPCDAHFTIRVLERVADQVHQHRHHLHLVGADCEILVFEGECMTVREAWLLEAGARFDNGAHRNGLEFDRNWLWNRVE